MLKPLSAALALSAVLAAHAATAAEPPSSVEDCLKAAIALAETAEEKTLADETRTRVENYLITLESHCEANRFAQAATLIADIETELGGS